MFLLDHRGPAPKLMGLLQMFLSNTPCLSSPSPPLLLPSSPVKTSNARYRRHKNPLSSALCSCSHSSGPHKEPSNGFKKEEFIPFNPSSEKVGGGLGFVRGKKLLRDLSSWAIGGPCNYFLEVFDDTQLVSAIRYCHAHSIRFLIIGRGSNCLFDDRGFDGCVILNRINSLERIEDGLWRVGSGYPFNRLGVQCSNEGFTGLEFAAGIPGTVGGATFMNAGADGQETADSIECVEMITTDGTYQVLDRRELNFGYRMSPFQKMDYLAAIVAITFRLTRSASARERQQMYLRRRRKCQPVGERSAGSVFRNPVELGLSAGELIERAGLKGFQLGGAKVSDLHANFFLNVDGSTSKNMLHLINVVKEEVDRKCGIRLKEEIQYVPYDTN